MRSRAISDGIESVALARTTVRDTCQPINIVVSKTPRERRLDDLRDLVGCVVGELPVEQRRCRIHVLKPSQSGHAVVVVSRGYAIRICSGSDLICVVIPIADRCRVRDVRDSRQSISVVVAVRRVI